MDIFRFGITCEAIAAAAGAWIETNVIRGRAFTTTRILRACASNEKWKQKRDNEPTKVRWWIATKFHSQPH